LGQTFTFQTLNEGQPLRTEADQALSSEECHEETLIILEAPMKRAFLPQPTLVKRHSKRITAKARLPETHFQNITGFRWANGTNFRRVGFG
jgi:hypothetical protein